MCGVDETLQVIRRAVVRVDGIEILRPIAMVAPITVCSEVSVSAVHSSSPCTTRGKAGQGKDSLVTTGVIQMASNPMPLM